MIRLDLSKSIGACRGARRCSLEAEVGVGVGVADMIVGS
jgi:hypothetical protein